MEMWECANNKQYETTSDITACTDKKEALIKVSSHNIW